MIISFNILNGFDSMQRSLRPNRRNVHYGQRSKHVNFGNSVNIASLIASANRNLLNIP